MTRLPVLPELCVFLTNRFLPYPVVTPQVPLNRSRSASSISKQTCNAAAATIPMLLMLPPPKFFILKTHAVDHNHWRRNMVPTLLQERFVVEQQGLPGFFYVVPSSLLCFNFSQR